MTVRASRTADMVCHARPRWAARIAWCQWSLAEIAAGDFWDVVKTPAPLRWCDTDMSNGEATCQKMVTF